MFRSQISNGIVINFFVPTHKCSLANSVQHYYIPDAIFRFMNNEVPGKNHCRKISLSENIDTSWLYNVTLNYDCFWSLQMNNYEHNNFVFEYNLNIRNSTDIQYGKHYFTVPSVSEIGKLFQNMMI